MSVFQQVKLKSEYNTMRELNPALALKNFKEAETSGSHLTSKSPSTLFERDYACAVARSSTYYTTTVKGLDPYILP